jgi:hypothetical protein
MDKEDPLVAVMSNLPELLKIVEKTETDVLKTFLFSLEHPSIYCHCQAVEQMYRAGQVVRKELDKRKSESLPPHSTS